MDLLHFWVQFLATHKKASLMNIPQSCNKILFGWTKIRFCGIFSVLPKKVKKRNNPSEHVHTGVTFKFPSIPWNPSWTPLKVLWRGACKPGNVQGNIKLKEHGGAEVRSSLASHSAEESRDGMGAPNEPQHFQFPSLWLGFSVCMIGPRSQTAWKTEWLE